MATRADKKVQTRDALVNAATRLFSARGYDAVTVEDVADAGGVSRRTLFRYFEAKEQLVFHAQQGNLDRFREAIGEERGMPAVRRALLSMAELYAANASAQLAQYRIVQASPALVAREIELDRAWESSIVDALNDRPAREARFTAGALIGITRAVLRDWLENDCNDDLGAMATEALDLLGRMNA